MSVSRQKTVFPLSSDDIERKNEVIVLKMGEIEGLDMDGARKECLSLEKLLPSHLIDEYADLKETFRIMAPKYGCSDVEDRFVFMYAMCSDYLRGLNVNNETLLNELYEIGPNPNYVSN